MWAAEAIAAKTIPLKETRRDNIGFENGFTSFPCQDFISTGSRITITRYDEEYYLWHNSIYTLPKEYVGDITRIISEK